MDYIRSYMIERANGIIKETDPIDVENNSENIYIRKNCFEATQKEPYFEDYCVSFEVSLAGNRYSSTFYLQWYDNRLDSPDEIYVKKLRHL